MILCEHARSIREPSIIGNVFAFLLLLLLLSVKQALYSVSLCAGCDQPTLQVELHDTVRTRTKHT